MSTYTADQLPADAMECGDRPGADPGTSRPRSQTNWAGGR